MRYLRAPRRAGLAILALAITAAAPHAAAAQGRLGRTTITAAVLDKFVAAYAAANAEDRRRNPGVETMSPDQMDDAKDRWEECQDGVHHRTATAAELATLERLQKAMQAYMSDPQSPKAIALSDSATTLMRAIERRAEPAVKRSCGESPEARQEREMNAAMDAPIFDVDSAASAQMGLDGEEWGLLRERIEMFLAAESPTPNVLWSAAELRVLEAHRRRLEAALNGEEG
jgi:hypothetical protein